MANALLLTIADALVSKLNGVGTFNAGTVTAERIFPQSDPISLADAASLKTIVIPRAERRIHESRKDQGISVDVDLGLIKKLVAGNTVAQDKTELDGLIDLMDELSDYLAENRTLSVSSAHWSGSELANVWAPEHLEKSRIFFSFTTHTYDIIQELSWSEPS